MRYIYKEKRKLTFYENGGPKKKDKERVYYVEEGRYHVASFRIWIPFEKYTLIEAFFIFNKAGSHAKFEQIKELFKYPTHFGTTTYTINENYFDSDEDVKEFQDYLTAHDIKWL